MPTTFGKYSIEKKLGQGGMGSVYLALDTALNRRVALKIISSTDPELLERFQREAAAVAKLKHPNIVQVYESGVVGKQHYFTMDYIEGVSLEKLISSAKRPSIKNIAEIIYQVASALHYAHQQNVVHRDIKPANIMVTQQEQAYIADFGLAKQLTGLDRSLTMTGTAIGTPNYMSPEQAQGQKDQIDPRSDIFSLGATLYHCITGRMPFDGQEIYEVLFKVINEEPPAPSTIARIIPKDLETICLKCLNKDKAKRYQTAGAFAQDLKRYLEGGAITARPVSVITKFRLKVTKNKVASLSIAGAVVILIAVTIGLMVSSAGKNKEIESYRTGAQKAFEEKNYDQARAICNKLLVLSPGDEAIKGILNKCEQIIKAQEDKKREQEEQAKEEAARAQRIVDLRTQAKAILDRANGAPTPEQKIKLAQDALKIDPTYGDAWQVIGYAYKEKTLSTKDIPELKELYAKAVKAFTKAIELTPTLAYSYYERAMITAYTYNKLQQAMPDFNKVLELDPNSHIGWFAKGNIGFNQMTPTSNDDAIASFTKAIELYPEYYWAYNNRGNAYWAKGDLDRAIQEYTKATEVNPNFAEAYCGRGEVYALKGEIDKTIADYTKALTINPRFTNAYCNRGNYYQRKGQIDKAIADYDKAIELNPNHTNAYANRGNAYGSKKEFDRAIQDLTKAIELNPNLAETYANRGLIYERKGDIEQAIKDYNKATELKPNLAEVWYNKACVNARTNKSKAEALKNLAEAIRLNNELKAIAKKDTDFKDLWQDEDFKKLVN